MTDREEFAVVLDYLPYGYPMGKNRNPVVQAVGEKTFILFELIPRRGVVLQPKQKVYIGTGKREEIYFIAGRLFKDKLTETAKTTLREFVEEEVKNREEEFVEFFNNAQAINTRLHQIELLPGFGKKHMQEVLETREQGKFSSFEDLKSKVKSIPDPKRAIEKRILEELTERQRFNLFVK